MKVLAKKKRLLPDTNTTCGDEKMSFYQSFASYYDRIFPLNQTTLSFVSNYFQPGECILDMGAGTGNLAIALADNGIEVTASEPDGTMAESIRSKVDMKGLTLSVHTNQWNRSKSFRATLMESSVLGIPIPICQMKKALKTF